MKTLDLEYCQLNFSEVERINDEILKNKEITSVVLTGVTFGEQQDFEMLLRYIFAQKNIGSISLYNLNLSSTVCEQIRTLGTHLKDITIKFCSRKIRKSLFLQMS